MCFRSFSEHSRWFVFVQAAHHGLLGDVHQLLNVVILVLFKGGKEHVQHHLTLRPHHLPLRLLFLLVHNLEIRQNINTVCSKHRLTAYTIDPFSSSRLITLKSWLATGLKTVVMALSSCCDRRGHLVHSLIRILTQNQIIVLKMRFLHFPLTNKDKDTSLSSNMSKTGSPLNMQAVM